MADLVYNKAKEYIGDGTIDLDGDTFKCILLDNGHTPDATDEVYTDVSGDELAGASGYNVGGYTLQSVTWVESAGTVTLDADDPIWTTATFTARYAVVYDDTPVSPADPLLCLYDFGADKTGQGGNFYVNFAATGMMTAA